jgi:ribosomal protein L11 methylase PrmA
MINATTLEGCSQPTTQHNTIFSKNEPRELDLSSQRVFASTLQLQEVEPFIQSTSGMRFRKVIKINLSGRRIDPEAFKQLIKIIKSHPGVKELQVTKSYLSPEQLKQLAELTGVNTLKGLKITCSEGEKVGPLHTNWDVYALEKKHAYQNGMRETTIQALNWINNEHHRLPTHILDFGAGTGQDAINLALLGCPKILAVDGDDVSLDILQGNMQQLKESGEHAELSKIECTIAPFITLQVSEPIELLVSSYTWPYRCPQDFPACWEKCVDIVQVGGLIAGQFFGPRTGKAPDPGMTYHTEAELRQLLSEDFEIVWFRKDPEGGNFKLFGGDEPAWGDLYHVVAKRIAPKDKKGSCTRICDTLIDLYKYTIKQFNQSIA